MDVKTGKHSKVEGPFKSFIMGSGVVGLLSGGAMIYNGEMQGIAVVAVSIAALRLGSKILDKNRVEW